ncbi:MAG TPA: hypothetical protein VM553_04135 [Dongiaceae bacterium]|nr:hypothetical protein [Dongiaceae bacterium]
MNHNRWIQALAVFSVGVATGWIVSPGPGDAPPIPSPELTESTSHSNSVTSSPQSDLDLLSGDTDSATPVSLQGKLAQAVPRLQGDASANAEDSSRATTPDEKAAMPNGETGTPAAAPEQLMSILRNGTEQERITALTHSLEHDIGVPADVLRETVQSDPSPEVRLLAFRMYVDVMSGDSDTANAALTLGAYNDDPEVREEAQMRLAEFELLQQTSVPQNPLP